MRTGQRKWVKERGKRSGEAQGWPIDCVRAVGSSLLSPPHKTEVQGARVALHPYTYNPRYSCSSPPPFSLPLARVCSHVQFRRLFMFRLLLSPTNTIRGGYGLSPPPPPKRCPLKYWPKPFSPRQGPLPPPPLNSPLNTTQALLKLRYLHHQTHKNSRCRNI